ncbi:LysR family transcriptional regulator [Cyanobium sp. BA20m-14]|uniref:helix-turn-helix domain-containing protein n=1 Tax=Cyanobium sp. BA20m-14 TaxID=2823703 RepID=UPI0020CF526A|nr:LysR family transcriptional regulator [Cyanobium sp. BA20m-14]MCP9914287.1 LysR family transcriptional regulator [Cyanobium sp. BA20m-14]
MSADLPRSPYRIPSVLRDLVLVDMLELTGSTVAAAQLLNVSQPSVSRRYRRLAAEMGLQQQRSSSPGRRFCDAVWMRMLRQGVNRHRLACGVLRVGGPAAAEPLVRSWIWAEWVPLPAESLSHSSALLELDLLDGVVLDRDQISALQTSDLNVLPLAEAQQLWLCCRHDPLVEEIARRTCRSQ